MFGLFGKAAPGALVASESDLVYLDDAVRMDAVAAAIAAGAAGRTLAVLSPFRDHAVVLRDLLRERGVDVASLDGSYRDAAPPKGAVYLIECARVDELLARTTGRLRCLQVERHPLRRHDEAVDAALAAHSVEHRVRRYLSLDDGLFTLLDSGPSIRKLSDALGLDAREAIEHALVSKSIASAQQKVAKKVREERPATSFAAWRDANGIGR